MPAYIHYPSAPFRRSLTARWFQPMIKVVPRKGASRVEALRMEGSGDRFTAEFRAPATGSLCLFVNDVLLPFGGSTPWMYRNNQGSAIVQIEPRFPVWPPSPAGDVAVAVDRSGTFLNGVRQ